MKKLVATLAIVSALGACATQPAQVTSAPVSPAIYQGMSCNQMKAEAARIQQQVYTLTGQQKKKANNDAVAMGVGMVLFWPALFMVAAGEDVAPQLAAAKGQSEALERAYIAKGCK